MDPIRTGCLLVVPAGGQVGDRADLCVDDGSVADYWPDRAIAAGAQRGDQRIDAAAINHDGLGRHDSQPKSVQLSMKGPNGPPPCTPRRAKGALSRDHRPW